MSLRPIGGIFWRLDASGNLTGYDSTGTVIAEFIGGVFSAKGNMSLTLKQGSGTKTTASTSIVSTGIGVSFTSVVSTRALCRVTGSASNNTASDGLTITQVVNTTGIPTLGTTIGADTTLSFVTLTNNASTAALTMGWSIESTAVVSVNQATNFYLAFQAVTGGTVSITISQITVQEI